MATRLYRWSAIAGSALAFMVCWCGEHAAADVVYVNINAPPGGDGENWSTAYNDLWEAMNAALPDDEVWVATGVYTPAPPNGDRDRSFVLKPDVSLYGGFAGDESSLSQRDWIANPVVLSGDLNGNDGPGFANVGENSRVVMRATEVAGLLSGVTLSGGNANNNPSHSGGGLFARDANILIDDCRFVTNFARSAGAVDLNSGCTATLHNVHFIDNGAEAIGALHIGEECTVTLDSCLFDGQDATAVGAVSVGSSATVFRNCAFVNNFALIAFPVIVDGGQSTYINCLFAGNTSAPDFGGCVFAGMNSTFYNCTFADNTAALNVDYAGQATLRNCIIWSSDGPHVLDENGDPSTDASMFFCDVEGGWSGPSNFDLDPLFVQAANRNYRLQHGSPCIDAGNNANIGPDNATDLNGAARIQGESVDLGPYEGGHDPEAPTESAIVSTGESALLTPASLDFMPAQFAAAEISNVTGGDNETIVATEFDEPLHPDAGGYAEMHSILRITSTMPDGTFFCRVYIPFTATDLNGADPALMFPTVYVPQTDSWAVATSQNTVDAVDYDAPIGRRSVSLNGGLDWGITENIGDYGVYWRPSGQRGFVWANVDYQGDFGVGIAACPADCAQPPDGIVNVIDILDILGRWYDDSLSPFDVDQNGLVDVIDIFFLFSEWGLCD